MHLDFKFINKCWVNQLPLVLPVIRSKGIHGVMVIIIINAHRDQSSNPGQGFFAFLIALIPWGKVWIQLWVNNRAAWAL